MTSFADCLYICYFLSSGCTTASVFIVAVGYATNKAVAIGLLCMGVGVTGLNATGYAVNILDIAPKFAGIIIGISNVFGSMPGFISPQIVGYITTKNVGIDIIFAFAVFMERSLSIEQRGAEDFPKI